MSAGKHILPLSVFPVLFAFAVNVSACGISACGVSACGSDHSGNENALHGLSDEDARNRDYTFHEEESESASRTFFVSPNGTDSGDGSRYGPWKTLHHAVARLQPGDKLYVGEGIYPERVRVSLQGESKNPIVISAVNGARVVLDGSGIDIDDEEGIVDIRNSRFVTWKGFKVQNSSGAAIYVHSSDHIQIRSNFTYNSRTSGIGVWESTNILVENNEVVAANIGGGQENITIAGVSGFEVMRNIVHHGGEGERGGEGIDAKHSNTGSIHHNRVFRLSRLGIYVDAWNTHTYDIEVYSNISHDNNSWGICLAAENGGLLDNIRVYNNVVYRNRYVGIGIEGFNWGRDAPHPMQSIYIYNNTVVQNGIERVWGVGIHINAPEARDVYILNNIVADNTTTQISVKHRPDNISIASNLIEYRRQGDETIDFGTETGDPFYQGSPRFLDKKNHNYRLKSSSPAIGRADASFAPPIDYDGLPRSAPYDIGAFEYREGQSLLLYDKAFVR